MSKLSTYANTVLAAPKGKTAAKPTATRRPAAGAKKTPMKRPNRPPLKQAQVNPKGEAARARDKMKSLLAHYKIKGQVTLTNSMGVFSINVRFSKTDTTIAKLDSLLNQVEKVSKAASLDQFDWEQATRGYFTVELDGVEG